MIVFPSPATRRAPGTRLVLDAESDPHRLPVIRWLGVTDAETVDFEGARELLGPPLGSPALVEHAHGWFGRPGLRGHRLAAARSGAGSRDVAGRGWSTSFGQISMVDDGGRLTVEGLDEAAGLGLRTEVEALPGGALRLRHVLTNRGRTPYLLDGLEVSVPLPAGAVEILDFTGRHEFEKAPQRHLLADGQWVRESRRGKPGLDGPGVVVAGSAGFGFGRGEVVAVSVAGSGNSVVAVQRGEAAGASISAGELLLPGEVVLLPGEQHASPWVVVAASREGLDGAAHRLHEWQRSLPAHPATQAVTLNVWEAVYFDHDGPRLLALADRAARIGVERFVLDDGWFHARRDDTAGLGDWWVDEEVWPKGLGGLVDHVRGLGLEFGLWFEPEMVNPDSDLYRAHPDWILAAEGRRPLQHRNQYVLDLTNPDVFAHLLGRIDTILTDHAIGYVKWDHNRDLLEAGSAGHGGAPAVHAQALAFHALLDELGRRHPEVQWESCSAGGGRIDLGVIERVQRFWTSDMTDAVARQHIQRWTAQYVAPEYLGAHVSAPTSHQTGRTLSLDFRAATAFFLGFGIEWDLTEATGAELDELAAWCALHKRFRPLLHGGRMVRIDVDDPTLLAHGVIATDGAEAMLAHVQLDDAPHNRGTTLRVPGLQPDARYALEWLGPVDHHPQSMSRPLPPVGPTGGAVVPGRLLADLGFWLPRRAPQTAQLIHITRRPSP